MLKGISYRTKLYLVIGGFLLAFLLAYALSFSVTVDLKSELDSKREMINNLDQVKREIAGYESKLSANSLNLKTDKNALQNMILQQVTAFCDAEKNMNVSITEFMPIHEFELDQKKIHTCSFSVKGSFPELLRLNKELEDNLKNAELSAVEFQLIEKRRDKKLIATYHVQNISEL